MNLDHDKEAFAELIAGAAESSVPGERRKKQLKESIVSTMEKLGFHINNQINCQLLYRKYGWRVQK